MACATIQVCKGYTSVLYTAEIWDYICSNMLSSCIHIAEYHSNCSAVECM